MPDHEFNRQSSPAARLLTACIPRASELQLCSGEVDDGARDVIAPSWHHPVPGLGFGSLALTQAQSLTLTLTLTLAWHHAVPARGALVDDARGGGGGREA